MKKKEKKQEFKYEVKDCNFTWVKFDWQAIDSINNISKALLNLTEIFKWQNITVQNMLSLWNSLPSNHTKC